MKTIASIALVALLAGCSGGGGSTIASSPSNPVAPAAVGRAPQSTGGPGTTSITYYDTYAPAGGPCEHHELTILVGTTGSYPAGNPMSFPATQGPPLVVSTCNFQPNQYVRVTLGKPAYGTPYIRQTDYTVTVDAPGPAKVTATWTACGPTLPCDPGLKGTVNFLIGPAATPAPL